MNEILKYLIYFANYVHLIVNTHVDIVGIVMYNVGSKFVRF